MQPVVLNLAQNSFTSKYKVYCCIALSNVVTPTRKSLEFKHASQ